MKRGYLAGFVLMLLLVSMISPLVAAGVDDEITGAIDGFLKADSVKTIITLLIGGGEDGAELTGDMLFVKLLFFILLIAIIYYAAGKVPQVEDSLLLHWIITLVVSLLAVRFIASEALINFIWLPTGVLGVVFAAFFPLVIYFFFIESFEREIIRKIGWVVFIVIYIGLAIYRWSDFGVGGEWYYNLAWMYLVVAVISIIVLILDKKIRARMMLSSLKAKQSKGNILHIKRYMDELKNWDAVAHDMNLTPAQRTHAENEVKDLRKEIAKLS